MSRKTGSAKDCIFCDMGSMSGSKDVKLYRGLDGDEYVHTIAVCDSCADIDSMKAEETPVVPDPSSFPQGSGRVLGQQTDNSNLTPLHAESQMNEYEDFPRQNAEISGVDFMGAEDSPSGDVIKSQPMDYSPAEDQLFDESVVQDEQDGGVDFMNAETHTYKELTLEDLSKESLINMIKSFSDVIAIDDPNLLEDYDTFGDYYQDFLDEVNASRQKFPDAYADQKNAESPLEESPLTENPSTAEPSDMGGPEDFSAETQAQAASMMSSHVVPAPLGRGVEFDLGAENSDAQLVTIDNPVMTGAKMALGVVALNATALIGISLIGMAIGASVKRMDD